MMEIRESHSEDDEHEGKKCNQKGNQSFSNSTSFFHLQSSVL